MVREEVVTVGRRWVLPATLVKYIHSNRVNVLSEYPESKDSISKDSMDEITTVNGT
jgi:hypothetical protein